MIKFLFYTSNQINFKAILVAMMSVISGIIAALMASMINEAVEDIITQKAITFLNNLLPYFLIGLLFLFITRRIALRSGVNLVEQTLESFRNKICNQLRQSTLQKIESLNQGEIYTKLSIDTKKISSASLAGIRAIQSIVTIILVIIYIYSFSLLAGICFTGLFALGMLYYQIYYGLLMKTIDEMTQKETQLFNNFGHVLDGFKEMKINSARNEDFFQNYLEPLGDEVKNDRILIAQGYVEVNAFCFILLYYLAIGSTLFMLPLDYSVALRFKIIAMSTFLWEPINLLSGTIPSILLANVSIKRLNKLERQLEVSSQLSETVAITTVAQSFQLNTLRLEAIQFDYTDKDIQKTFSVGPIDINIHAGEIIFFVGGNGSGKSTVLKLITGLYQPQSGRFFFNDMETDMDRYRHLFSVIFTDCYLFDSLYGINQVDDQQVIDLLALMQIDHKVKWKNRKLIHSELSTGQKKRLAFVVALLEDKPIYILDEWAAEQDPVFRKKYYLELLPMLKKRGKTIIATTHDDQYFHVADKVITMNYGKMGGISTC
jgi:putative ATP-binding cassette transporter